MIAEKVVCGPDPERHIAAITQLRFAHSPGRESYDRKRAEGHTTKEVARILGTSQKTVENQRGQLMKRLGIRDLAGLVRYAIQSGLIASNPSTTAS